MKNRSRTLLHRQYYNCYYPHDYPTTVFTETGSNDEAFLDLSCTSGLKDRAFQNKREVKDKQTEILESGTLVRRISTTALNIKAVEPLSAVTCQELLIVPHTVSDSTKHLFLPFILAFSLPNQGVQEA